MSLNNVLIVDDDNKFRALLHRFLEKRLFLNVAEAENGIKGLEAVQNNRFNLIFLDITMPHMDGIEFLEKMRQINKTVPVVVMTCIGERESVQKIVELGVASYLLKTDLITDMTGRIEDIVSKFIKD